MGSLPASEQAAMIFVKRGGYHRDSKPKKHSNKGAGALVDSLVSVARACYLYVVCRVPDLLGILIQPVRLEWHQARGFCRTAKFHYAVYGRAFQRNVLECFSA